MTVLAGLTNLQFLDLRSNRIEDISALAGLTNLEHLELSGNPIEDIRVLLELPSLKSVYLGSTNIDMSPGSEAMQVIEALKARGVTVDFI